jgi:hypothetical protein
VKELIMVHRFSRWLVFVALLAAVDAAQAQLPAARLTSLSPAGGQQGKSFDVTIAGSDLDEVSKLHFSHAGITAVQKTNPPGPFDKGPQPVANQFTVSIAANVPIGMYEARAIGRYGISSPRTFMVGELPEAVEKEPNQPSANAAPLAFSATVAQAQEVPLNNVVCGTTSSKDDLEYFKFTAKKGDRVLIDCWAHRIDSKMDASLAVYDANGRELGSSRDFNRRDPFVDLAVPADGVYIVKLWDSVYGGGGDYFYRLAISTTPFVDFVFPPAGQPGTTGKFTLYGRNLPGGAPADGLKVAGRPLEKLVVDIAIPSGPATEQLTISSLVEPDDVGLDGFEYRVKGPAGYSNPVLIGFAAAPVVAEQEPNSVAAKAQSVALPCEFVGQFQTRGDQDWLTFEAKKAQIFILEVIAKRQRSRTDPEMVVQRVTVNKDGQETVNEMQKVDDLAVNIGGNAFDTRSDDPLYRFVAPDDGKYRVLLKDLYLTGDPRSVYRVSIRPETPDFRLAAVPFSRTSQQNQVVAGVPLLRKGGQAAIDVLAFRRDNFDGEIRVSVQGLPAGVTCPEVVIGPTSTSAPLVFRADEKAAPWAGVIQIVGKAKIGDKEVVHEARGGSVIWPMQVQQNQPVESRMTRNLALAVSEVEDAPYNVEVAEQKVFEISRAGKLEIPLKATRRGDFKGAIALAPVGLPQNIRINNMNIDAGKADAKLAFDIPNNAPLGTYSFYLTATSQVPYKRNPEAATRAEEAKKELDQIVKDLTEANKKAADAKTAAEKAAAEAAAEVKKTTDAKAAADKAATEAAAALKAAEDKAKSAKEAAEKDAANQGLADAKAAADKALAESTAKAKTASEAKAAAEKAAADAAAKAKTAEEAKAAATTAATEAAAKLKMGTDAQAAAAKRMTDAANAAKSNNVNAMEPTMPITISIAPAPITLGALQAAKVKQGEKVEVAVPINRLFGYADTVDVEVTGQAVPNVKIAKITVPKDQSEAKLVIEAAANAPAGNHTITLRGTAKLNGQNLTADQPLTITIEAAAAAEEKK